MLERCRANVSTLVYLTEQEGRRDGGGRNGVFLTVISYSSVNTASNRNIGGRVAATSSALR